MRIKLLLSFAVIVTVAIGTVVLIVRYGTANEVRAFMMHGGMVGADELVSELEAYYQTHGSWQGAEALLKTGGYGPGGMGQGMGRMGGMMGQGLRLADVNGQFVFDSNGATNGRMSDAERESAISLVVNGQTVGYLLVSGGMAYTPDYERPLLNRLNNAALVAALIAGGVALLLALLLAYQLLRPIGDLTRAAQRLASGDLSQRVPLRAALMRGEDELTTLGRTFNQMAEALQSNEARRRAMTADIAHELRNPLAVQRANLEALQDGVYAFTPENLQSVLEQNLLLARLVDDLRTLALADAGQLDLERVPTDFPALVESIFHRFDPQATARGITVTIHTTPPVPYPSLLLDPLRIEQILSNLLSNALRYTPDGGQIACTLTAQAAMSNCPPQITLALRDNGPGIPEEALPSIFERFFRADKSRSREAGGSGLGLAIARQLAQVHGGALTAANHPDGGALFTLTLPVPG